MAHLNDGSGIQQHSAGPEFPGVVYVKQFADSAGGMIGPHAPLWFGALFDGFDYGVFATHAQAVECIALVKAVRAAHGRMKWISGAPYGQGQIDSVAAERALARHLEHRAARAGTTPARFAFERTLEPGASERTLEPGALERDTMPVDGMLTPILIRMRCGYNQRADAWLAFWGYNPADFQAHGVLAGQDDGTRRIEPRADPVESRARPVSGPRTGADRDAPVPMVYGIDLDVL